MPIRLPAIVLHWNNPEGALRTARSIREHAPFCDVTIIENGSPPAARKELEARAREAEFALLCLDENRGFTGGMNFAVTGSGLCDSADFVLLASHGVEVTAGCIDKILAAAQADVRAGLVAPRISRDSPLDFDAAPGWESLGEGELVDIVRTSGALLLFRVAAFRSVGGFDERMFAYYEDIDLAKRLRKAGWRTAMVPAAVFFEDGATLDRFARIYLISRNRILSSHGDGRLAVLRELAKTALGSGRTFLASVAPWRSADRRAASRLFARGHFYAAIDAIAGVTGPGRAAAVIPKQASEATTMGERAPG